MYVCVYTHTCMCVHVCPLTFQCIFFITKMPKMTCKAILNYWFSQNQGFTLFLSSLFKLLKMSNSFFCGGGEPL